MCVKPGRGAMNEANHWPYYNPDEFGFYSQGSR